MDHTYIEEHNLIERYGLGRLSPDEEMRFEEHFLGCVQCQEELEMERGFRRGLKRAVAEEAGERAVVQAGLLAWLAQALRRPQAGLAIALLLAVTLLPAAWFGRQNAELRQQSEAASNEIRNWKARYSGLQAERDEMQLQQTAAEERWDAEKSRLEARLDEITASSEPSKPERPSAPALDSLVNVPLFLLGKLRSEDAVNRVDPAPDAGYFSLAVDVYTDPRFLDYRLEITDTVGEVVWQQANLLPNALEVLLVTFQRGFLPPGRYRLTVSGRLESGALESIESYPFEIRP